MLRAVQRLARVVTRSPVARGTVPLVTHVVPIDEFPEFMDGATTGRVEGYIKGVVTTA